MPAQEPKAATPATPAVATQPASDNNEDEEAEIDIDAMLSEDEEQSSIATMMTPAEKASLLVDVVHIVANNPSYFQVTPNSHLQQPHSTLIS